MFSAYLQSSILVNLGQPVSSHLEENICGAGWFYIMSDAVLVTLPTVSKHWRNGR